MAWEPERHSAFYAGSVVELRRRLPWAQRWGCSPGEWGGLAGYRWSAATERLGPSARPRSCSLCWITQCLAPHGGWRTGRSVDAQGANRTGPSTEFPRVRECLDRVRTLTASYIGGRNVIRPHDG